MLAGAGVTAARQRAQVLRVRAPDAHRLRLAHGARAAGHAHEPGTDRAPAGRS